MISPTALLPKEVKDVIGPEFLSLLNLELTPNQAIFCRKINERTKLQALI